MIENLVKANYELLRESLKGKRMSELHYKEMLFQGQRIVDGLDLLKIKNLNYKKDSESINYDEHIPQHYQVISNDEAYRKYLNFDDTFSAGNIIHGLKNRYDDPVSNRYPFEMTAENIIGLRYKPMLETFNEIRDHEITTMGYTQKKLTDLPLIDSHLTRLKTWITRFPETEFNEKQWFSIQEKSMIKPKNFESNDPTVMFQHVKSTLQKARDTPIKDPKDVSMFASSLNFKIQTSKDAWSMEWSLKLWDVSVIKIWINKIMSYKNSLNQANLLPLISSQLSLKYFSNNQHLLLGKHKANAKDKIYHDTREQFHVRQNSEYDNNIMESNKFLDKIKNSFDTDDIIPQDTYKKSDEYNYLLETADNYNVDDINLHTQLGSGGDSNPDDFNHLHIRRQSQLPLLSPSPIQSGGEQEKVMSDDFMDRIAIMIRESLDPNKNVVSDLVNVNPMHELNPKFGGGSSDFSKHYYFGNGGDGIGGGFYNPHSNYRGQGGAGGGGGFSHTNSDNHHTHGNSRRGSKRGGKIG